MIESLFFWTGQGFQLLANSDNWFRDGTFKVYPEVFFQLYTVHAKLAGTVLPCISALLPNKQGFTYTRLFQHVLAAVEPLQNGPSMMILILKNLPWMLQKMFLKSFFLSLAVFSICCLTYGNKSRIMVCKSVTLRRWVCTTHVYGRGTGICTHRGCYP